MRNRCWLAASALVLALACALAPSASALVVHPHHGHHFLGIQPHRGLKAASIPGSIAATNTTATRSHDNGTLSYHSGPVVHSSAPYLIFWVPPGESISASSERLMERYFSDVAADNTEGDDVFGVSRQYTDATGFAGGGQTFNSATQAMIDTQRYPPLDTANCPDTSSSYPACVTDAQLQQELRRLVATDGLPSDGPASATELPQNAPIYFFVLPSDVNVCASGLGCADTTFCAYHSSFTDAGSDTLLYAAMPMLPSSNPAINPKNCQSDGNTTVQEPNGDPADLVIDDIAHEDNETLTDPLGTGWWDPTSGDEEADGCSATGPPVSPPDYDTDPNAFLPTLGGSASAGTLYDQLISSDQYYTQSLWSNGDTNCEMRPSAGTITPAFSETPAPPYTDSSAITFNPAASKSTNTISSETWDFGDGSTPAFSTGALTAVSHTYAAPGTYTVRLTLVDNRGNLQSITHQVTIDPGPAASFTSSPTSPLENTAVAFDGSSSTPDPGATIKTYAWNFGDGTTGTGTTPTASHTYATYGTYTVTLTVTDSDGLSNTTSQELTVGENPTPSFTISPGPYEVGQPVTFDGTATDVNGTISSYTWNFGDQTTGSGQTASHSYAASGTYTITLTVVDSNNQTNTTSQQITVYSPPTASFTYSPSAPGTGNPVSFDATGSSDPDQGVSITSYAWNFGDNTTGSGATPSHTYSTPGTYPVTLTVTNSVGLSSTTTQQLSVDESPTASFTISPGPYAVNQPITVNGIGSTDPDGTISTYSWNFGSGFSPPATSATATNTYATPGPYTITLKVTDTDGQTDTTSQQITVYSPPTASFTYSQSTTGTSVSFNGKGSSDPDQGVSISSYAWTFGVNNATGSGATPSYPYSAAGTYTVTLTVTNSVGLTSKTITKQITVDENPTAGFTIAPGPYAVGRAVTVDGSSSTDPDGTISSYSWSFGDGSSASGTTATASHVYTASGTYTITLTVVDSSGRTNTSPPQQIVVYYPPTASLGFSPPAPVTGTSVGFDGSSSSDSDPGVSITSYAWSFGDGTTGSGATTSHIYPNPGNYTVTLVVTNSVGLTSTNSEQVTVFPPPPIASFTIVTAHPAAAVPVRFNGSLSAAPQESISSYAWSFGDGSTARGVTASHTYKKAGIYRVTLTITSSSGVSATADDSLVVVTGGRIKRISISAGHGSDLLAISLTGPGKLSVGTRRLRIARAETIRVRLTPTVTEQRLLRSGRDVKVTVPIVFTPQIGRATKTRRSITFRG